MSTLHTVNKSPFGNGALLSCLKHCTPGDAVILIEDGVYGALSGASISNDVGAATGSVEIFVLDADGKARGLDAGNLLPEVKPVGYDGFVDLAAKHERTQSWL